MRKLLSLAISLIIFIGCANQPTQSIDVVGEFHKRYTAMCEAMDKGDIERAEQLSRDMNTWLEGLSAEEQTLISRTLTQH